MYSKNQYKIVSPENPFCNLVFNGHCTIIDSKSRIWDDDSQGRSYPSEDCRPILDKGNYSYDIHCENDLCHIFDKSGNIVYQTWEMTDIFLSFYFNNAIKEDDLWSYSVNSDSIKNRKLIPVDWKGNVIK